nr:hypothetical protein [Tanacetum cinerariifolium]
IKKLERRNKLKVLKLRILKKVGTAHRVETSDDTVMDDVSKRERILANMDADGRQAESQAQIYQIDLEHTDKVLSMQDDEVEPGIIIRDPKETATPSTIIHSKAKSKDKGKGILVEEPKPLKKQAQIEQDEAYARELKAELNKNIDWDEVIDHVQGKEKEDNAVKRRQRSKWKKKTIEHLRG